MRDRLFIVSALAASILAGMASTTAAAATTGQLPGQGRVVAGQVSVGNLAAGTMSLNVSGPSVINWGGGSSGATINAGGPAGFNVGSGAHLNFNGSNGAAVLNIDSSGQPSQIYGTMSATGADVFVANGNGIIVGANARISSDHMVGLIANRLASGAAGAFDGSSGSIAYNGTGGDVTVLSGASFSGGGKVLIAGGGNVNVDLSAFGGPVALRAGRATTGADNTAAALTVSGKQAGTVVGFSSAGSATNLGTLSLTHAKVDGKFVNSGTLKLASGFAISGRLVNGKTVNTTGHISVGGLTNKGSLSTGGVLAVNGTLNNSGTISSPSYRGRVSATGMLTNTGSINGLSYVGVTGGDLVNSGSIALVDREDLGGTVGMVRVSGGNLRNSGSIASARDANGVVRYDDLSLLVVNGSIDNQSAGKLANFGDIGTGSDTSGPNFQEGADYSITNAGTITGNVSIDANLSAREQENTSTGSFSNTGVLNVRSGAAERDLSIAAHDNLDLGGTVKADGQALGSANSLDGLSLQANKGKLTVATPLTFHADGVNSGAAYLTGHQVEIASNLVGLGSDAGIYVTAGRKADGTYAFNVDPGVTFSANHVYVGGP